MTDTIDLLTFLWPLILAPVMTFILHKRLNHRVLFVLIGIFACYGIMIFSGMTMELVQRRVDLKWHAHMFLPALVILPMLVSAILLYKLASIFGPREDRSDEVAEEKGT